MAASNPSATSSSQSPTPDIQQLVGLLGSLMPLLLRLQSQVFPQQAFPQQAFPSQAFPSQAFEPSLQGGFGNFAAPNPALDRQAAENFIGATVSYIDGAITNTGDKTVTHVVVQVNFEDSMGQVAQREDLPLRVVKSNGAYEEPVDLSVAPLAPGQSESFRLTFDSISAQWNHQYPDITITDVVVK